MTKKVLSLRPYLQNPQMLCPMTKVLRVYRAMFCPACKACIKKHSRHSIVFARCIGAPNEFLAILFFLMMCFSTGQVLWLFWTKGSYGLLTKIMFYALNGMICWQAFIEVATLTILVYFESCRICIMESLSSNLRDGILSSISSRSQRGSSKIM